MVTVYRSLGLRIVIYLDDHEPAHVHVFGDGEAKINLQGPGGGPEFLRIDGMTRGQARRAMKIDQDRQEHLLARWKEIHG